MAVKSIGNCYLCGANLGKTAMKTHLLDFHGEDKDGQECYLLKVEGSYNKDYWLYIDVPVEKPLSAIDGFLRKIWLECCGHLSEFCLPGHIELRAGQKWGSFAIGTRLIHLYDFGTTTETAITIMGIIRRKPQKKFVRLLARNAPPVFQCADCGKVAEYICIVCIEPFENLFFCADCGKKNEDDDHILLPVTNSPRMGMCAYDGEYDTFAFNPASIAKKQNLN